LTATRNMFREAFSTTFERMRAPFLAEQAQPLEAPIWDQSAVRERLLAARLRLKPARRLFESGETIAGLVLYRDACRVIWASVPELLEHAHRPAPPGLERQAALLSSADGELLDRMSFTEAVSTADDLASVVTWAIEVVDRPTREQRRLRRRICSSVLSLVVLLLIAAGAAWLGRLPNLALGRPAAASGVANGTTPGGAVDGVRYGFLGFYSNGPALAWWSVDLGQPYALDRVKAYGRADCCFDQSIPLQFEVSLDGKKYRQVAKRSAVFSQSDPWVIPGAGEVARFIRFRTLRKTHLVLGEVEVYGRATTTE
jgi:hypothetical protein